MLSSNKNICIIFCGALDHMGPKDFSDWLKDSPELRIVARATPFYFYGDNTADITPHAWIKLAKEVNKLIKKFDGIVIMHGADNLLYTGSALSFLFQNPSKPIVFAGSHVHPVDKKLYFKVRKSFGVKASLINAVQLATFTIPEVMFVFGNRFGRISRALQTTPPTINLYDVPEGEVLGKIDFSIRMQDKDFIPKLKPHGKTKVYDRLNPNIEVVKVTPNFHAPQIMLRIATLDGVIFDMSGLSGIPIPVLSIISSMNPKIPVVLYFSQGSETQYKEKNVVVVNNMTLESTVAKLMWTIAQTNSFVEFKKLMRTDLAGEIGK